MTDAPAVLDRSAMGRSGELSGEFLRYAIVGGLAFALDWSLLRLSLSLGAHYPLATAIGFIAGLSLNYALCLLWVWRGVGAPSVRGFLVFSLIGLGGLGLTEALMWLAVDLVHLSAPLAKVPIAGLVLVWNFVLRRLFVFPH